MFGRKSRSLWLMGIITLVGFPVLAIPLLWYQDIEWSVLLGISKENIWKLPYSLSYGIVFGLLMIFLTELSFFKDTLASIKNRLMGIELNVFFVIFLSICAGVGEEIFFRGALQPLIGIGLTSLLFVGIHGYFSLTNLWLNFFGFLLFLFILSIAWLSEKYGIWLAITAHFSYDLVLLFYFKNNQDNSLEFN